MDDPVRIPIERELDLHAFAPRDVSSVVDAYIDAALASDFDIIRLIHGRGQGILRGIVHSVLARHPAVSEFWDDPTAHLGATCARLATGASGARRHTTVPR